MYFKDVEEKIMNLWDYKQLQEEKKKSSFCLEIHTLCYNIIGKDKDLEENHSRTNPH